MQVALLARPEDGSTFGMPDFYLCVRPDGHVSRRKSIKSAWDEETLTKGFLSLKKDSKR